MTVGRLSVVATPIGNLSDASPRMREVLASADLILAEDSRRTGRLLTQFGIDGRLLPFHEHNERDLTDEMVTRMRDGAHLALVSDAGTPAVSDPGFRLIRAAHAAQVRVETIPGPSAVIAALSASGLPTDRFCFEGFLPAKPAARRTRLHALQAQARTMVFFEAVHRIAETMADCVQVFGGDRIGCIARELTKKHEQIVTATLDSLLEQMHSGTIVLKGEFVLLVSGTSEPTTGVNLDPTRLLEALLKAGVGVKSAATAVAEATGAPRNTLYQHALEYERER